MLLHKVRETLHDALRLSYPVASRHVHLQAAMAWLCRAHDVCDRGGVSRSYSMRWRKSHRRRGWLAAYPETTGYIIPTFLKYAARTQDGEYRERALQMARWEAAVQMENGAVQGSVIGFKPTPAIFNTGQVLFGWAAAYRESGEPAFLSAATRAADFLVGAQDADGAWRRHGSKFARSGANVYDARSAWGLLEASLVTGDARHRAAAVRNLDFALGKQLDNGWYAECCLDDDELPLLHTIAYTMEGLLEGGAILGEAKYVDAARRAADALLPRQRPDGSLGGRFDAQWNSPGNWSCLTGEAQTAIVWLRLHQLTNERTYADAASRILRYLCSTQNLRSSDAGIRGAIKGSHPIWADYGAYEYLNWAAKFFADALMLESENSAS